MSYLSVRKTGRIEAKKLLSVFSRFFTTFALEKIKTIQKVDNKRTRTTYSKQSKQKASNDLVTEGCPKGTFSCYPLSFSICWKSINEVIFSLIAWVCLNLLGGVGLRFKERRQECLCSFANNRTFFQKNIANSTNCITFATQRNTKTT